MSLFVGCQPSFCGLVALRRSPLGYTAAPLIPKECTFWAMWGGKPNNKFTTYGYLSIRSIHGIVDWGWFIVGFATIWLSCSCETCNPRASAHPSTIWFSFHMSCNLLPRSPRNRCSQRVCQSKRHAWCWHTDGSVIHRWFGPCTGHGRQGLENVAVLPCGVPWVSTKFIVFGFIATPSKYIEIYEGIHWNK